MKILNSGNTKTRKGEKLGFITYGIHLAPFNLSGYQVCKDASEGCAHACLNLAGRGTFSNVQQARIEKTRFFFKQRKKFMAQLIKEITLAIKRAQKKRMKPCFRLNLTSDLPWEKIKYEGKSVMEHFPSATFYDYTKSPERMSAFLADELPANYQLTFSRSESNAEIAWNFLPSLGNVAMVFRNSLPKEYFGYKVIDGDDTDLRFLDPEGCIVGLIEKGKAKSDESGFVIEHEMEGAQ
jgi:hypothetical protein